MQSRIGAGRREGPAVQAVFIRSCRNGSIDEAARPCRSFLPWRRPSSRRAKAPIMGSPSGLRGRRHMAEAAGDVLTLATSHGQAEARRMGRTEAGESRWCIRHPWGTETFYGTAEQVMKHMKRRVTERDAGSPTGP